MAVASRVNNPLISYARFKRTSWAANWPFNTVSVSGFYRLVAPALSVLGNLSEYTALFDVYKVHKVTVTFIPRFGDVSLEAGDSGPQTAYNNQFYCTVGYDRNNVTAPTGTYGSSSFNEFLSRVDNPKTYKLDKPFSYSYTPNILNSAASGTSVVSCPWLSTTNTTELLLGSLAYIHDVNFTNLATLPPSVDIMYTLDFSMKGNR